MRNLILRTPLGFWVAWRAPYVIDFAWFFVRQRFFWGMVEWSAQWGGIWVCFGRPPQSLGIVRVDNKFTIHYLYNVVAYIQGYGVSNKV